MIYFVFPNDHILVVSVIIAFQWLLSTPDYLTTAGKGINFVTSKEGNAMLIVVITCTLIGYYCTHNVELLQTVQVKTMDRL